MEQKQLVWAKMKRYSPWPGVVVNDPSEDLKKKAPKQKNVKCIFFFGAKNFAWIEDNNLKPYLEFKDDLIKSSKLAAFKEAVKRIEEYIGDPIKYKSNAEPDQVTGPVERDVDAVFNKLRENDGDDLDEHENSAGGLDDSISMSGGVASTVSVKTTKTTASSVRAASAAGSARKPTAASLKKERNSLPMKFKVATTKKQRSNSSSNENGETPAGKRKRPNNSASIASELLDNDDDQPESKNDIEDLSRPRRNLAAATQLLSRPSVALREAEEMDMNVISDAVRQRNVNASELRFGFLGLGIMGAGIVKNLINTGHKVVVWNRTFSNCLKFQKVGAEAVPTPADVVDKVDILFSCVSHPAVAKEMVFGNCGVLSAETLCDNKGYVEMTGVDDSTSQDICDAIVTKGGRYLEAQMQGSKKESEEGTLVIMAAGDRGLYDECSTCFDAMGSQCFYLGDVGVASKMYVILQMISGVSLAVLGEAMALATRTGISQHDLLEVLRHTSMASDLLLDKGKAMINSNFETHHPLMHVQKDLKLALSLSESVEQPMPLCASANEVYKHAKRQGYAEHDSSAVYVKSIL